MKAVDYSFARFTGAQLKAARVAVAFRYLTGTGKAIGRAELDTLLAAGIQVVLCYEMLATDATSGATGGASSAHAANAALLGLGLPVTTPVYFAADTSYSSITTPLSYFAGICTVRPASTNGVYGEGALCQGARARGYVAFTWQSMSRSYPGNATTLPTTDVQQSTTTPPLPGTDLDLIEGTGDFGQLPRPVLVTPPRTIGDPVQVTTVSIPTDPNGNGWLLTSVPWAAFVSATGQGSYPPTDGYWVGRTGAQERTGNVCLTVMDGPANGRALVFVVSGS